MPFETTIESGSSYKPLKSWLVKYEVQNIQSVTTELNGYSEEEVEEYLKKQIPNLVRIRAIAQIRKD